jgi:hypothetical protein
MSCLLILTLAAATAAPRFPAWLEPLSSATGLVDDFEHVSEWAGARDGGRPPTFEASTDQAREGQRSLKIVYRNQPPGWGSLEKQIQVSGDEQEVRFWLYVQQAGDKAAMHIWLFEHDGDAWMARVAVGERNLLAQFGPEWVEVVLPIEGMRFEPRGQRDEEFETVSKIIINCNFDDFIAYIDELRMPLPEEARQRVEQERERREQATREALERLRYEKNPKANIAVFRDERVPIPPEAAPSDPTYLGELLTTEGYGVSYLTAQDLATGELLAPERFQLLVLPYGPSFPDGAVDNLRRYLAEGGRFFSTGGYAFDNVYLEMREDGKSGNLVGNGGFEQAGAMETDPAGWQRDAGVVQADPNEGVSIRRVTDVKRSGSASLRISVPQHVQPAWYNAAWRLEDLVVGKQHSFRAYLRLQDVRDGHGAYIAANFYDEAGKRITFQQSKIIKGTVDWTKISCNIVPPRGTAYITLALLLHGHGTAWFDDAELSPLGRSVNTRVAPARDALHVSKEQIGVFDPSFKLVRVAYAKAAEEQYVVPGSFYLEAKLSGFAACGLLGSNGAVSPKSWSCWTPLVRAYDQFGRLRGSVGAIMRQYAGPYQGSAWAFFGVTSRDLFPRGDQQGRTAFLRTVKSLLTNVYLHDLRSDLMCYEDDEPVQLTARVRNDGIAAFEGEWRLSVWRYEDRRQVWSAAGELRLEPSADGELAATWEKPELDTDLYGVTAWLEGPDGPMDRLQTGFVVRDDEVRKSGLRLSYRDNYFHVGERPMYLIGTNQTGVMLADVPWENPLQWEHELRTMQDYGLNVLRILHISSFAEDLRNSPKELLRGIDALVQVCQKHKVALFPCMHDWIGGITIEDEPLAASSEFARVFAGRLADVPGIIIDVENEASVPIRDLPDVRRLWNDWLRERYGTDKALQAAWHCEDTIGDIPYKAGEDNWHDRRTLDANLFRVELVKRWMDSNCAAIHEGDPSHAITDEYYLLPGGDAFEADRWLDFCNIHRYGGWPAEYFKFYDRRAEGRGVAVGEFGARHHPSFRDGGWGYLPEPEVWRAYSRVAHLALAVGGTMCCNWDWKDMEGCIFPWGLQYPCDLVPKDVFYLYRNLALIMRRLELEYRPPEAYLVVPDLQLLGPKTGPYLDGLYRAIRRLICCRVPFAILRDHDLSQIPSQAKVLVYPHAYTLSDETYEALRDWVRAGGVLQISGDISFDENRERTRARRLEELCGVRLEAQLTDPNDPLAASARSRIEVVGHVHDGYPCIAVKPSGAEVVGTTSDGVPVYFRHRCGAGVVLFATDPLDLHLPAREVDVYLLGAISAARIRRTDVSADDPDYLVFELQLRNAGRLYVILNESEVEGPVEIAHAAAVDIPPGEAGLVAVSNAGEVTALETFSKAAVGGRSLLEAGGHIMAVCLDGQPLIESKQMIVIPQTAEPWHIASAAHWADCVYSAGEIVGGEWQEHARGKLREPDTVTTPARDIVIIAEEADLTVAVSKVLVSVNEPERM